MAGAAFDSAAARMGISNGTPATEHVRAADFQYLATQLGEVLDVDSPLSEEDLKLARFCRCWRMTPAEVRALSAT